MDRSSPDREAVWRTMLDHLRDPTTSWNIAAFGAVAEFHRDPDEDADCETGDDWARVTTARGAIRIRRQERATIIPFEGISRFPTAWTQGVAVCLLRRAAHMSARKTVTPLGADAHALDDNARGAFLFDLGVSAPNIDACVRTGDKALIRILEANAGRGLFEPDNPALRAIKDASPVRVFLSRMGRIEVYQSIGSSGRDVPTPTGPHTHVLPDLLAKKRTHAATVPIPSALMPSLAFFPANPVRDEMGELRAFDREAFLRFEGLLEQFADARTMATKRLAREAVRAGRPPEDGTTVRTRAGRTALRVALRQIRHTDGPSSVLEQWKKRFDPTSGRGALDGHDH